MILSPNSTAEDGNIHLRQAIYHCRPFIILSGWLTISVIDNHSQWLITFPYGWYWTTIMNNEVLRTIIYYVGWYSLKTHDIQLQKMIFICEQYSSTAADIHPRGKMMAVYTRWQSFIFLYLYMKSTTFRFLIFT
jgi:hypothetical protein